MNPVPLEIDAHFTLGNGVRITLMLREYGKNCTTGRIVLSKTIQTIKLCPKCKHELVAWGYDHSGQVYKCVNNHYVRGCLLLVKHGKEIDETKDTKVSEVHKPEGRPVPVGRPRSKVEGTGVQRPKQRRKSGKVMADADAAKRRRSSKTGGTGRKCRTKADK